jgi:hypothetical protein
MPRLGALCGGADAGGSGGVRWAIFGEVGGWGATRGVIEAVRRLSSAPASEPLRPGTVADRGATERGGAVFAGKRRGSGSAAESDGGRDRLFMFVS